MKILVFEDEPKIAGFLTKGLRQEGHVVDAVSQGLDGLSMIQTRTYDLVLLDLMLPDIHGFEILKRIKQRADAPPVIILSALGSVDSRVHGLELGADDYMTKPISFTELCGRIGAIMRRRQTAPPFSPPCDPSSGNLNYDRPCREVQSGKTSIQLSEQEALLFEFLTQNPGVPVTKRLIFEHVWNYDVDPQTNVVDVLVCRLRAKLQKVSGRDVIQTVRGLGYMLTVA